MTPRDQAGSSVPPWQARFWVYYWTHLRPYLMFLSGASAMVGASFVAGPLTWRMLLVCGVIFFTYGFGQALTDCFQTDTDAISSPYRPLVRGLVTPRAVGTVSLLALLFAGIIIGALDWVALILALVGIAGIASYTWFKRRWWGGPIWNSWIVALLAVIANRAVAHTPLGTLFTDGPFLSGLGAIFFSYANFVVVGYLKDLDADRQTGYRTFPLVFGWRANALLADANLALATACTWYLVAARGWAPAAIAAAIVATAIGVAHQVMVHRREDPEWGWVPALWSCRASVAFPLAIVIINRPRLAVWMALYYLLFELALRQRPEKTQI